ncbi:hypothetical protein HJG54_33365 [Leptolyngbya sp. NK1-12]|uniref:HEAT repeat domain-containing protein n=1 Tax=Leptolyngbya sp. NK1-12 TaxID=2547451 RepID=A0AA96WZB6_9CYAN|nr:hypothetical protein [Leptolyngbya sp. NK1-12]RNJ70021.1 MAG: hypothetical protein EDM05_06840 [Leptolyngbya sp. IPPAS B-1204]WNZ27732.1 hypothetical protein HJG54_33365 [Leptolyngbya sp. NK1-12]
MLKLFHLGLAVTTAFGIASAAMTPPALATEANSTRRSTNPEQTVAAVAILGTGAALIAYSATRGNDLPEFNHSEKGDQTNFQLQKKLLRLLHNDRNAAKRLLAHVKQTHPDRSANWVLEKVIYDLERDRNRH